MKVLTRRLSLATKGENNIIDVTEEVRSMVQSSEILNGIVTLFVHGSTAAITTMEYEPGLLKDLPGALERVAPRSIPYEHEEMWHDGNGHSHVRASIVGPSLTIPFVEGRLTLGTWQQVVLLELDIRPRKREVIVQILGE